MKSCDSVLALYNEWYDLRFVLNYECNLSCQAKFEYVSSRLNTTIRHKLKLYVDGIGDFSIDEVIKSVIDCQVEVSYQIFRERSNLGLMNLFIRSLTNICFH